MPQIKTDKIMIPPTSKNYNSISLPIKISLSEKDYTFKSIVPDFFKVELDNIPNEIIGNSIKDIYEQYELFKNKYSNIHSQLTENNIVKYIFIYWNYSFENNNFSYSFNYTVAETFKKPLRRNTYVSGLFHSDRGSYQDKNYSYWTFEKPLNNFFGNPNTKGLYEVKEHIIDGFSDSLMKNGWKKCEYSEDIINKLEYFKYTLENFSKLTQDLFEQNKDSVQFITQKIIEIEKVLEWQN